MNSNSRIISTDEDPSLRIESSAITNLRVFPQAKQVYVNDCYLKSSTDTISAHIH